MSFGQLCWPPDKTFGQNKTRIRPQSWPIEFISKDKTKPRGREIAKPQAREQKGEKVAKKVVKCEIKCLDLRNWPKYRKECGSKCGPKVAKSSSQTLALLLDTHKTES